MNFPTTNLDNDIRVACIKASSFPDGVLAAHQQLHALVAFDGKRKFFGISYGTGNGQIEYMAAVEELPGDLLFDPGFPRFTIKSGTYLLAEISDFRKDIPAIGKTFEQMLKVPGIDPHGACIEWYPNMNDIHCMVRLADHQTKN